MVKQAWSQTRQRPTKQQVRALERLLKRDSLPPEVRAAKEAELAKLTGDVQKQNRVSRERHFSKKYHGVKFVERRKVERRIEQLQRKISQPPAEGARDVASLQHFAGRRPRRIKATIVVGFFAKQLIGPCG